MPGRRYIQAGEDAESMVTTNNLLAFDAFGNDPPELVHLTGSVQVVTRVMAAGGDDRPAHVEVCVDAARVRGVGLSTGIRYQVRGACRFVDDLPQLSTPLHRIGAFEVLRHGSGDSQPNRLLLV